MTDEPSSPPAADAVPAAKTTTPERRASGRRLRIIGGSVAGAAALIAVAAVATAAALSGGPVPMVTPTESRTPSASAEPALEPLVAPAGLGVPCARLLPNSLVSSIMAPDVSLLQDSDEAAWSINSAMLLAAGGADCRWSNEVGPSTGAQEEIELQVIPDASDAYRAQRELIVDHQYTRFDLAGEASNQQCGVWGAEFYCTADTLVRGLWIHLDIYHSGTDAVSEDGVHETVASLLREAAAAVRGAEGSGLQAPGWIATSADLCALAATISGAPFSNLGIDYGYSQPSTEAQKRGGVIVCRVPDSTDTGLVIYPGLAWAWSDVLAGGQNMADLQPVDLPGADAAASGPSWDGRSTFVSVGGAIVTTWEESATAPSTLAARLAAAYAGRATP